MGQNSRRSRRISRGGALHRKGERNSKVGPPFPESPRYLRPFQGNQHSLSQLSSKAHPHSFTTLDFLSISCGERLLLRCDGNTGNSFPTTQGKNPSSRARRRKRGSSACWRDSRASSRVEMGMSGNFLSCSKGVKDPWKFQRLGVISLESPQRKWASSRLEGTTSWIFSS